MRAFDKCHIRVCVYFQSNNQEDIIEAKPGPRQDQRPHQHHIHPDSQAQATAMDRLVNDRRIMIGRKQWNKTRRKKK